MVRRRKPSKRVRAAKKRSALKPRNPHAAKVRALVPKVKPSVKVYRRRPKGEKLTGEDDD